MLAHRLIEMRAEGRARRDAVRGAKHRHAHRHREPSKRGSAPASRGQRRADFSASRDCPNVVAGSAAPRKALCPDVLTTRRNNRGFGIEVARKA